MTKELSGNDHDAHAVNLPEQSGTPVTPSTGRWKSYFTSSGQYFLDDAGTTSYVFNDHYHLYPASDGFYYVGSRALRMAGVTAYQGEFTYDDSATNTVTNVLTLGHNSSGTPAASFGTGLIFEGETTTTVDTSMARIRSLWTTATHASRAGSLILSVNDASAERDAITITTSGSAASVALAQSSISIPTTSLVPLTLRSTDDNTTNPVLKIVNNASTTQTYFNYNGSFVINEAGNDADGRIEGDTDPNLTVWDAGVDEVVFGSATVLTSKVAVYAATASKSAIAVKTTDDSSTTPIVRGYDSSSVVRWSIAYDGTTTFGKISGGTYNGNLRFNMHDQFPSFVFRTAGSTAAQLIADVNAGSFNMDAAFLDLRTIAASQFARFDMVNKILNLGLTGSAGTTLHVSQDLSTTTSVSNQLTLYVGSTGTPAAGHGAGMRFNAESSTTANREQVRMRSLWVTATDASRTARGWLSAYDTAERDCIAWEASGSAAMVGFFGTNPVVKPTALTTALTSITHTAPGTPDYAIQNLTLTGYGFVTQDEGNTVLSVILNLQARVNGLETKLQALGLLT